VGGAQLLKILFFIVLFFAAIAVWRTWRRGRRRMDEERAAADFVRDTPQLQEDFRAAANVSGKPRGLRWKACEFQGPLLLARDRVNGKLVGLIGATVSFEAIAGGGMEEVEAVGNLRAVTAIFTWSGFDWTTSGRPVFNLEPRQVLEQYRENLAPIAN
jgi:uncharacterized membrane protein YbhN (UPF0104 family)